MEADDDLTLSAIENGRIAGACRRAALRAPRNAKVWLDLANEHSAKACEALAAICERSGLQPRPRRRV